METHDNSSSTSNAEVFDLLRQLSETTKSNDDVTNAHKIEETTTSNENLNSPQPSPHPDPSRITDYPTALKYIVKYLSPNDYVMDEVRVLIQNQERKEREWVKNREDVLRKQKVRSEGQAELANVLKMVGAGDSKKEGDHNKGSSSVVEENERELAAYDLKIYQSAVELAERQAEVLRELKIPLFFIHSDNGIPPEKLKQDRKKVLELLKDLTTNISG